MSSRLLVFCLLLLAGLFVLPLGAQEEEAAPEEAVTAVEGEPEAGATGEEAEEGAAEEAASEQKPVSKGPTGIEKEIDDFFGNWFVGPVYQALFFDVLTPLGLEDHTDAEGNVILGPDQETPVRTSIPFIVLWLVAAAVFFTLRMGFINLRLFRHAIDLVRGKYDSPDDEGEVTSFQALSSALSATVGLGNIAGVALAIAFGGPGAMFWMMVAGFLGMTLKFTECTLGQKYRQVDEDGNISGGPMHYLKEGFARRGLAPLGIVLAIIFTICCIGGSFAGGNAFQVFQSKGILAQQFPLFESDGWIYGLVMAVAVGFVIIGGFRRIAQVAEKIVPTMCGIYVLGCLAILIHSFDQVPAAFGAIFQGAFSGEAIYGGALGALIMGFRRAAFSNEAGAGSASIAHSAAKTPYPVREGIVALLEPFIDTVVVCTITALVIIMTGVYNAPENLALIQGSEGAALTNLAFESIDFMKSWFPYVLTAAVILFAFSTMISWSYYGERCWTSLFGARSSIIYKFIFLGFVFLGSIMSGQNALDFGDLMILSMALPNIIGLYVLQGDVVAELKTYLTNLRAGNFPIYK